MRDSIRKLAADGREILAAAARPQLVEVSAAEADVKRTSQSASEDHPDALAMRINVYIDGFNFYYSVSRSSDRSLDRLKRGWCNFVALGERLVGKAFTGGTVGAVKYFTAPVGEQELRTDESLRQELWLNALRAGTDYRIHIIEGFHAEEEGKARVEKQTDTNIAISMLRDALMSTSDTRHATFRADPFAPCDGVILISGDRDLHPAVRMLAHYGVKPVIFRPGRDITDEDLWASTLPDSIKQMDGSSITWKDYTRLKSGRW